MPCYFNWISFLKFFFIKITIKHLYHNPILTTSYLQFTILKINKLALIILIL
jgi:hypothetical protein